MDWRPYPDLEAAEVLVSMSSWGQSSHKLRPLTPTCDSCDSLHLEPDQRDLVALSSLGRSRSAATGTAAIRSSLALTNCPDTAGLTRGRRSLPAPCATAASCVATTWPNMPAVTWPPSVPRRRGRPTNRSETSAKSPPPPKRSRTSPQPWASCCPRPIRTQLSGRAQPISLLLQHGYGCVYTGKLW